ncbi:MAG: TIGR03905 family TSCPD domain-containing protein [Oscillospiraceae bacterium]|jgi:uncharacterized protein (TIGR03905 family)|nr:TIGR03905 family TSCPD domain-containing protein [Oscillospiraceae bacterium]
MTTSFKTKGTCSRRIDLEVEDGIIKSVAFVGGCDGNLQGISRLVAGLTAAEAADRLRGIDCDGRGTSCPDQLAKALDEFLQNQPRD